MFSFVRSLFSRPLPAATAATLPDVHRARDAHAALDDDALRTAARRATSLPEVVGIGAVVAARVLGVQMYDVQLSAALSMAAGHVVEMQTGEGKTLAAVPAVAWLARHHDGVHVLTANDYLAARDAAWMGNVYAWFGLRVASIVQATPAADRRAAYEADVTYTTAREVGFDYLRDGQALAREDQVLRGFGAAVIDEADSLLIDEARIPLILAGGEGARESHAALADLTVRGFLPGQHFTVDDRRRVSLTPTGVRLTEHAFGCENLFDADTLNVLVAVQHALHAHTLLTRDVDYVVTNGVVQPVDGFTGRLVPDRRWPPDLQVALEVKEGVGRRPQGRVLGAVTVEHLLSEYACLCGMTGTAATQADELREIYGLAVVTLPTHRPVIRRDLPDIVFDRRVDKEVAVRDEIRRVHATGRPVLVGTASVEESERLSRALGDLPHQVLNARHAAREAAIVAGAGVRGAVTISTNMAGRGVDIALGPGVADLGGLHVIGTNRHESRRTDHQLRGRAGRQGDPGTSQFLVSREDPLIAAFAAADPGLDPEQYQRWVEGAHRDARLFLRKYEHVIEAQRRSWSARRQAVLDNGALGKPERRIRLDVMDDLWADYLAAIAEQRSGTAWISLGLGNPFAHYLTQVHAMFGELEAAVEPEVAERLAAAGPDAPAITSRGATWTYCTTDEPFGRLVDRIVRGVRARGRQASGTRPQASGLSG